MKNLLFLLLFTASLLASTLKPVMIYDSEILDDKSWNAMIHQGIERFSERFGVEVKEVMILDISKFNAQVKALAEDGYDPIMVNNVDSIKQKAIKEIVLAYPKKRFIIFNGSFEIPNADFFVFAYREAAFLAGYLATKTSKTGKIGFVGGMKVPIIQDFLCGYMQGA
ncbi:MAG: BMP family ABC transporter substrate-binding protein, partial [Campylobacterales bacterium]|nr:BMP family ABC transporter substrate-binding protein [Campylobacterales bacterium]